MYMHRKPIHFLYLGGLWAFHVVVLMGLAACGATGQPASSNSNPESDTPAVPVAGATASQARQTVQPPTAEPSATAVVPTAEPSPSPEPPTAQPALDSPTVEVVRLTPLPKPAIAPTNASLAGQSWQLYHSEQAAYSVSYPADWRVTESGDFPHQIISSFGPEGRTSLSVVVSLPDPDQREPVDLPAGRCQPVKVGSIAAMRCFDTITFRAPRATQGVRRQFVVTIADKRLDAATLQRFLESFTLQ